MLHRTCTFIFLFSVFFYLISDSSSTEHCMARPGIGLDTSMGGTRPHYIQQYTELSSVAKVDNVCDLKMMNCTPISCPTPSYALYDGPANVDQ
jgi:hypothetical protein